MQLSQPRLTSKVFDKRGSNHTVLLKKYFQTQDLNLDDLDTSTNAEEHNQVNNRLTQMLQDTRFQGVGRE